MDDVFSPTVTYSLQDGTHWNPAHHPRGGCTRALRRQTTQPATRVGGALRLSGVRPPSPPPARGVHSSSQASDHPVRHPRGGCTRALKRQTAQPTTRVGGALGLSGVRPPSPPPTWGVHSGSQASDRPAGHARGGCTRALRRQTTQAACTVQPRTPWWCRSVWGPRLELTCSGPYPPGGAAQYGAHA